MDERNNIEETASDSLLDLPGFDTQILPDEEAMAAAGLTHPDDASIDRLLAEAREQAGMDPAPEEFRDEEYRDAFGEGDDLDRLFSQDPYTPEAPKDEEIPAEETGEETPSEETPEETSEESSEDGKDSSEEVAIRKRRPKAKKGYGLFGIPHILATAVWLAIIMVIGVSLGRVAWICVADVLAFGREEKMVVVEIEDTDTLESIALKLQEKGLIRYPELWKLYAGLTSAREDISSGTFTLNTIYDYNALVDAMTYYSSSREIVQVMIPEGYSCAQMFALLEEKGVCKAADLEEYAAHGELDDYWFLEGVERGDKYCLEGYLFPDTYDFYVGDDAGRVLEKMLDDFNYRFSEDMVAAIDALNETLAAKMRANGYGEEYIEAHKMTVREVIIVASLIEKETANNDESFKISSVIYNRLTNQAEYPYLNIDAALLYALGHKESLTLEDTQIDSPYNTYTNPGLIPGPITNPGLNSMKAALLPEDTGYYFYALDPATGEHHFSKTYAEHLKFLESLED